MKQIQEELLNQVVGGADVNEQDGQNNQSGEHDAPGGNKDESGPDQPDGDNK
jgi:hypothetical protein